MLGRLAIAAAFLFVAFLFFGGWWLMWRKSKDRRERRSKPDFSCLTDEERSILDDWHGLPKPYQQTYRPDYVPAPKDRREQIDIDRRIEHIQMVKIPPEVSERLRRNILRDIAMYRIGGGPEDEVKILQVPQKPKEIEPCSGCRPNLKTITKGGG